MANRKKTIDERKSMRFTLRLSPNDYKSMLKQAEANHIAIADYIRTSALYCAFEQIEFISADTPAKPLKKTIKSNK